MAANYTDIESVKRSYMGPWNEDWNDWVTEQIPVVSAMLRAGFRNYGRNLDSDIDNGYVEDILVKSVANSVLGRKISTFDDGLGGSEIDITNLSASAGPYQFSKAFSGPTGGFFIKREEWRLMGLPAISLGAIDYTFIKEDPNGHVYVS